MKTYTLNAIRYTLILAAALLLPMGTAYAYDVSDSNDRLSSGSSSVFSPGYINAAKQKTEAIISQLDPKKSFMEKLVENIKNGMSGNVDKAADTKVVAEIKKKTSAKGTQTNLVEASSSDSVKIGKGDNQEYENGRLISEFFDGKRYVYAGFTDVGKSTIQGAIDYASNKYTLGEGESNVIVMGGRSYYGIVSVRNGVSLFGGYDETGKRNMIGTPSTITGGIWINYLTTAVEINGFTIQAPYSFWTTVRISYSLMVTFANNNVTGGAGLGIDSSSVLIRNNTIDVVTMLVAQSSIKSINNNYNNTRTSVISGEVLSNHDYFQSSSFHSTNWLFWDDIDIKMDIAVTDRAIQQNERKTFDITPGNMTPTLSNPYNYRSSYGYDYDSARHLETTASSGLTLGLKADSVGSIFKGLLESRNDRALFGAGQVDSALLQKLVNKYLEESGLLAITDLSSKEMGLALALTNILKNPTEDQKFIIDAIMSLLKDISKIEGDAGKSEELKKAEDELLQMVAAVLLAQGIPDLLQEGDVESIKGMFNDLVASKDKIILDYGESIKVYYNNISKEIDANMDVLQIKGIVAKKLTEEQLKKLEPKEIDRILENIRKSNDKSFELQYILQQDSKYRKEYLDPSKKLMEDQMKNILGSFARKLNEALEEKK